MSYTLLGGIAALISAATWGIGSILWRKIGDKISPFSMNLSKGILGSLYLTVVLLIIGFQPLTVRDFVFLGISGLLGIALGDTFFFMSLMNMGPRLTSLIRPVTLTLLAKSGQPCGLVRGR